MMKNRVAQKRGVINSENCDVGFTVISRLANVT